jgi:hypothetical protein
VEEKPMSERARQERERHDRLMDPENPEAGVECPFYDPETDDPILDRIWEQIRKEKERRAGQLGEE